MWVTREIDAPADVVWDLLVDTARWPDWGPTVKAVALDGDGTDARIRMGRRGRVRTLGGVWLAFEVTDFDDGRSWSWRVAGIPATRHRVEGIGVDCCRAGFAVPGPAAPYALVCRAALRRIEALAGNRLGPGG